VGARAGRALRQQNSYAILRIPKNPAGRENPQIMKKILLDTLTSFRASLRNSTTYGSSPRGLLLIPLILVCFALSPQMEALSPPPDGGYPNGNTAEGDSALSGLTGGFYNSAVGFLSLLSNGDANFNTGVGAGVLLLNTANENTAVGAGALFSNTTGSNTAVGSFAMFNNTTGGANTAIGFHTLLNNVDGNNNAAFGVRPLEFNTSGGNNTAIGNLALQNNVTGSENVALGRQAGIGITTASNVICVGHGVTGISTTNGELSDSCYIGNIVGAGVDAGTASIVFVDQDGKLGTTALPNSGALPGAQPQANPQSTKPDTVLNGKVEKLQTTVAQQEKQIEILTTQLKEQAAQIQKVSAQLEVKKPAAQVVSYDH
jgi:hypothetical protein